MRVRLTVNRDDLDLDLEPRRTLADTLRTGCGLTGTHLGCADGTCGACTVLVDGEAVRSCLMLGVQCDGAHVRTVEGLAVDHPLRAALTAPATPDGACVPGLVMLAAGAIDHDPDLSGDPGRLRRLLASNACRDAGHDAAEQAVIRAAAPEGR